MQLLRTNRVSEGASLLGEIARQSPDELQRSLCLYNLGEVLERLGRGERAYRTWYDLAHKPPDQRNKFDLLARARVLRMFESAGLRLPVPDFPPKVQLEITNRCNLRCIMCTRNQMSRPSGDMSFETFQKIADEVSIEPGTVVCLYFLGEPLLNKQLERMVAYLTEVSARSPVRLEFGIQTNGMLLTKERSRSLLEAGLREFAVSIDGLENDLERIRPGASYPVVEQNVLDLIALGREMGIDELIVQVSKLCDDPNAGEVRRFRQRWEPRVQKVNLLGISKVEGNAYLTADGNIQTVEGRPAPTQRVYCGHGQRLLVHWNGDFAFCCGDINHGLALGHVRDRSLRDVWHSEQIRRIRRKIFAADYAGLPACLACPHSGSW